MDPVNVLAKFEVRSWDNSGYLKTLGSPKRKVWETVFCL